MGARRERVGEWGQAKGKAEKRKGEKGRGRGEFQRKGARRRI